MLSYINQFLFEKGKLMKRNYIKQILFKNI